MSVIKNKTTVKDLEELKKLIDERIQMLSDKEYMTHHLSFGTWILSLDIVKGMFQYYPICQSRNVHPFIYIL